MAKYKVLVIAITVKNNGIAKSGDIIDGSQLNSSAEELIKEGFIELVETEEVAEEVTVEVEETEETEELVETTVEVEETEELVAEVVVEAAEVVKPTAKKVSKRTVNK